MTAMTDVELLPLPEWTKRDDLGGLVPSEVRVEMQAYTRANLAPLQAENERLRAELDRAIAELAGPEPTDGSAYYWACRVNGARRKAEARAERLAEALRGLLDVGDKFTGDPNEDAATWVAANDAARAALAQEDRNG